MSSNITLVDKLNPTRFYETLNKKNINSKVLKDTKNKTQNDQNPIFYLKEKDLYLLNASDVNKKNDYEDVEIKLINKINEDLNNLNIIEDIMKKKTFSESSLNKDSIRSFYQSFLNYSLNIFKSIYSTITDTLKKLDLKKQIISLFNKIKSNIFNVFEKIKNEAVSLFNSSCDFISNIFYSIIKKSTPPAPPKKSDNDIINDLMQRVKELKETIKSSKIFIHTIIEKIRDTGKIKIVNKLNNNPLHPEYQSTFPDLHLASNKIDNSNQSYLSSLNEQFDLENKNNIINRYLINKIDNNFKKSSIPIDIPEKIKEKIKLFFEKSKPVNEINQDFMEDFHSSLFIVDGNLIYSTNKEDMIREFKKIVPNIEDRKFISTYARPKLLNKSYFELISEHPELNEYRITNSRNIYEINHLKDGTLQLIVTNLSDISPTDDNSIKRYCAFGVRASAILSPESNSPIMEYSHFLN